MPITQVVFKRQWLQMPVDVSKKMRRVTQRTVSRQLIQQVLSVPLDYHRLGQPYFPSHPRLGVSVSHTHQLVMVAVGPGPLGIDVEQVRPYDVTAIRRAFTSAEWQLLQALSVQDRYRLGWQLWTAKEAVLKLVGCGLTHAPSRVEVLDLERGLACYQTQLYQLTPLELPATHEGFLARPLSVG
ncbi:4'-phosphopantetheinyl transferase superfamily protein [Lactiplantibacillus plantarum]|uniref:4'-phosphopantetheinyl transferase family protein n=1 Tax=Lactiplantibacillus plantarum TaxID=1590 RepID=UPI0021A58465|nr:4'-phosphopantetheinyl transferase superfamily protein [Lactiplantibacillus plantarum]MCT3213613.1 4'-phosphopantetheinyl transferase superfamily protein [Lactiplantibacillus plantarum]MCT3269871.1 4'-phosphopantetheinyl transferase superfamily protein [Lactiplantibacillus plantarum]